MLSGEATQYRKCAENWGTFMAAYIARCAGYRLEETLRLLGLERKDRAQPAARLLRGDANEKH